MEKQARLSIIGCTKICSEMIVTCSAGEVLFVGPFKRLNIEVLHAKNITITAFIALFSYHFHKHFLCSFKLLLDS